MLEKIKRYLKQNLLLQKLPLHEPFTVEFLAQGEYNQNFLLSDNKNRYVFRLNYGSQLNLTNQIRYEYQALKWLERTGRTPKVYYVDDSRQSFDQGLLIMAFLPGNPLDYHKDLSEAATIFSQIHKEPIDEQAEIFFVEEKATILSARVSECQNLLEPVFRSSFVPLQAQRQLANALETCQKK